MPSPKSLISFSTIAWLSCCNKKDLFVYHICSSLNKKLLPKEESFDARIAQWHHWEECYLDHRMAKRWRHEKISDTSDWGYYLKIYYMSLRLTKENTSLLLFCVSCVLHQNGSPMYFFVSPGKVVSTRTLYSRLSRRWRRPVPGVLRLKALQWKNQKTCDQQVFSIARLQLFQLRLSENPCDRTAG